MNVSKFFKFISYFFSLTLMFSSFTFGSDKCEICHNNNSSCVLFDWFGLEETAKVCGVVCAHKYINPHELQFNKRKLKNIYAKQDGRYCNINHKKQNGIVIFPCGDVLCAKCFFEDNIIRNNKSLEKAIADFEKSPKFECPLEKCSSNFKLDDNILCSLFFCIPNAKINSGELCSELCIDRANYCTMISYIKDKLKDYYKKNKIIFELQVDNRALEENGEDKNEDKGGEVMLTYLSREIFKNYMDKTLETDTIDVILPLAFEKKKKPWYCVIKSLENHQCVLELKNIDFTLK